LKVQVASFIRAQDLLDGNFYHINTQAARNTKMPVTVRPSTHGASLISFQRKRPAENAGEVLKYACRKEQRKCLELLQSSFDSELPPALLPSNNGLVGSVIDAYSSHHHLSIRPEDVWFAILTQLSTYVNKHAEELREHFVAHEGKKELWIT